MRNKPTSLYQTCKSTIFIQFIIYANFRFCLRIIALLHVHITTKESVSYFKAEVFIVLWIILYKQKQTDKSLEFYQKALEAAKGQREVELMCQYELGNVLYCSKTHQCIFVLYYYIEGLRKYII